MPIDLQPHFSPVVGDGVSQPILAAQQQQGAHATLAFASASFNADLLQTCDIVELAVLASLLSACLQPAGRVVQSQVPEVDCVANVPGHFKPSMPAFSARLVMSWMARFSGANTG